MKNTLSAAAAINLFGASRSYTNLVRGAAGHGRWTASVLVAYPWLEKVSLWSGWYYRASAGLRFSSDWSIDPAPQHRRRKEPS